MIDFNNKHILITGGSSGIGKACVDAFSEANANTIYLLDLTTPNLKDYKHPNKIHFIKCDLMDELQVNNAIKDIEKLDILINCAGYHPDERLISEYSIDDFKKTIDINLTSVFSLCKKLEGILAESKGVVVNISSMVGILGQASAVDYCAAKAGINGLTRALAIDWSKLGIRVNAICPSNVDTPATTRWANTFKDPQKALESIANVQKPPRLLIPEEIANVCLFMASGMSSCLTGLILEADGGASLDY